MARMVAMLLLLLPLPSLAAEYGKLIPERSRILFASKQMGVPIEGSFGKFTAAVSFDPARPEVGKAQIEVDLASADAGSQDANDELKTKGWFNTREFPKATFVAEPGVRALGNNRFEARGKLSIKGRTRDVVVPFELKPEGANAALEGSIPLLRTQFGIGEGPWADTSVIADEVPLKFRLVFVPISAK